MKRSAASFLKFIIPLALGVFLVWFIYKDLTQAQKTQILDSIRNANYWWIGFSFILGVLSHISRAHRWTLVLKPLGYRPLLINSFSSVMVGYLANLAFPRLGEVTRCGVMSKNEKIPFDKLLGTVMAERVLDMLILGLLTAFTLFSQAELLLDFFENTVLSGKKGETGKYAIILVSALVVSGSLMLWIVLRSQNRLIRKLRTFLLGFFEGFKVIFHLENKILFIFHTLFIWAMYFSMFYVCFFSIPELHGVSLNAVLASFVLGSFGIIATQGGIGAYHALVASTLVLYGISFTTGFAFAWVAWLGQTLMILILGFGCMLIMPYFNRKELGNELPGAHQGEAANG